MYKAQLTPRWFQNNTRFWYRNDLRGGTREFVVVDVERGTRAPAFDHAKLAAALSQAAGADYKPDRLPFDSIEFVGDPAAPDHQDGALGIVCGTPSVEDGRVILGRL